MEDASEGGLRGRDEAVTVVCDYEVRYVGQDAGGDVCVALVVDLDGVIDGFVGDVDCFAVTWLGGHELYGCDGIEQFSRSIK